jgi:hypothetical protein
MGYKIMNRELNATSLEGIKCIDYYEQNKQFHVNPKYVSYGDVLIQTKHVLSGFSFKFKIYFRNRWLWKPHFYWKYGNNYFHWLFFMFWFEYEYVEVFDKIIKDHLTDS